MKGLSSFQTFFAAVLLAAVSSCSSPETGYVRRAVSLMDRNGLFAEGTEWEKAKKEALSSEPSSMEEAHEVAKKALKVAGGKHSHIIEASVYNEEMSSTSWEMPSLSFPEEGIALVKVPQFMGNDDEGKKYAMALSSQIPQNLKGAIIDLRGNLGGNMYPMIASLQSFIPDGIVINFKGRKASWGISLDAVLKVARAEAAPKIDCPVAVLTDSLTASSGEATLLCFRGLENVRTFGGPTAGYASANNPYPMKDGSRLVLTTSCDMARTGEIFCDDPISPDVLTKAPVEDALGWIRSLKDE
ncbi:MAG: S41 family peptidase [Bacteroidales bacterium]|nr:S41 family peptidase [Bacteroidales bacterium]